MHITAMHAASSVPQSHWRPRTYAMPSRISRMTSPGSSRAGGRAEVRRRDTAPIEAANVAASMTSAVPGPAAPTRTPPSAGPSSA